MDDLVLFGEASANQAGIVARSMECFTLAAGPGVYLETSKMYVLPNDHRNEDRELSHKASVGLTSNLGEYLDPVLSCKASQSIVHGLTSYSGPIRHIDYPSLCIQTRKDSKGFNSHLILGGMNTCR